MSSLKEYIKKHLPETVCVCVTVCVFIIMSVYAIILYSEMLSQNENTFEETNIPAVMTEKLEETQKTDYCGGYYTVGSGTKYHTSECHYVTSGSKITAVSAEDIKMKGFEPCSKCIK